MQSSNTNNQVGIPSNRLQDYNCTLSCSSVGDLVQEQQDKGLPLLIAAVNKKTSDSATLILSNMDDYEYFDAHALHSYIFEKVEVTNPNNKQQINKIIYLWNGIYNQQTSELEINPNQFSVFKEIEISSKEPQANNGLIEIKKLGSACQNSERLFQLYDQIDIALQHINNPKECSFWIKFIHKNFVDAFLYDDGFDATSFKTKLLALQERVSNKDISTCLSIIDLIESNKEPNDEHFLQQHSKDALGLTLKGLFLSGDKSLSEKEKKEGIECLTQALEIDSNIAPAWHCLIKNDPEKTYELLQAKLEKNPSNPTLLALNALYLLGHQPGGERNFAKAYKSLVKALSLSSANETAHILLGECLRTGGEGVAKDTSRALQNFIEARKINPKNLFTLERLGDCYLSSDDDGDIENAIINFQLALSYNPESSFALSRLGECYRLIAKNMIDGDSDTNSGAEDLDSDSEIEDEDAENYSRPTIGQPEETLENDDQSTLRDLNTEELDNETTEEIENEFNSKTAEEYLQLAINCFKKALEVDSHNSYTLERLAKCYRMEVGNITKNTPLAIECYQKALEIDPKSIKALKNVGDYYLFGEGQRNDLALDYYMRLLEIDPNNQSILANIGLIYMLGDETISKDNRKAVAYYKQALDIGPDNSTYLYSMAKCYFEGGEDLPQNIDLAIELCTKSLNIDPDCARSNSLLGECYELKGNYKLAIEHFERAIDLTDSDSKQIEIEKLVYCCNLAVDEDDQNIDLAIDSYKKCLDIDRDFALAISSLAMCYQLKGDYKLAIEHFEQAIAIADDEEKQSEITNLADCCFEAVNQDRQNIDLAIASLEKCLASDRGSVIAISSLAKCYQLKGDYKLAIEHFEQAIAIADDEKKQSEITNLAYCCFQAVDQDLQNIDLAIHSLRNCLNTYPDYNTVLGNAIEHLNSLKNSESATKHSK